MKIRELFATGRRVFSFEFFPPKSRQGRRRPCSGPSSELRDLQPGFVSVTYGAGGSTRDLTVDLVTRIQKQDGLLAMAHLTCAGASRSEIAGVLDRLVSAGIENVIALRGDPPAGQTRFETPPDGFAHASDLVAFIRKEYGDRLCLAGAAYPEGHIECRDLDRDLQHLVTKVRAGVDVIITQLFFDNRCYFDFVARARAAGITVPIVPGIMPITQPRLGRADDGAVGARHPARRCRPSWTAAARTPRPIMQLGLAQAAAQCADLLHAARRGSTSIR